MQNMKLIYESREPVIELFNDYFSIEFKAKYKTVREKAIPNMSASVAWGHVANAFKHSNLKILIPKQILQGLPIALAQMKAYNTSKNLLNEIRQIIFSLYWGKNKKVHNSIISSLNL